MQSQSPKLIFQSGEKPKLKNKLIKVRNCLIYHIGMNFATNIRIKTCEANSVGENSSFISPCCIKSVSLYHFKLLYVVLHMTLKEFLETLF